MKSAWLGPVLVALASPASAAEDRQFEIPEQPLAAALLEIARQGRISIIAPERLTRGLSSRAVHGSMTPAQAVERALAGSPLGYRMARNGTIVIVRMVKAARKPRPSGVASRTPAAASALPPQPVQDIVVRAQRRAEFAQDVPLSVSAFGQEALTLAGIGKAMDLQQLEPSLLMSAQSGAIIPFLRGIGNPASSTPGNESSVPVYIDDVYFSRLYPAYLGLDHVDRVEVLKGPQGTLFGRNSTGGLIQIFTRDPGSEREFEAELGLANFSTATAKAYLAGPLSETLAANLSVSVREQGDGWGRNRFTGNDVYATDFQVLRSKLVWRPADSTQLKLSGFYARENSSTGTVQGGGIRGYLRGLPPLFDQSHDQPAGFYDIATNFPTGRRHRGWGGSLRIEHDLDSANLTSISFFRKSRDPWTSEGDHTPYPWLQYTLPVRDRQFTQEFQIKSNEDSPVRWIFGLYFMDSTASIDPTSVTGEAVSRQGYESYNLAARQTIRSKAVYGQATVPILYGSTRLTAGLRYTADKIHGIGDQYAILPVTGERRQTADHIDDVSRFDKLTWKLAVDRDLASGLMAYASYSRGFKSGTYNLIPLEMPALNPERVDAYEAGIKATLLDGKLQLNLSAFRNNITDPQVQIVKNVQDVATNQFVNAQRARSQGVELSGALRVSSGLNFRLAGQVLDAKFIRFEDAPFNRPLSVPPFGVETLAGDASGNATPLSPKLKLSAGLTHRFRVEGTRLTADANLSYRSSFKWEPDNLITEPSLALLNASLTAEPDDMPRWSLRLWCNNITGEKYFSNVLTQSGPTGFMSSPAEPRTFGIALAYRISGR